MIKDMICKALEETGLTQKRMAEMLGVPLRTLENWKAGERTPNEFTANAIEKRIVEIKEELKMTYRLHMDTISGRSSECIDFDSIEAARNAGQSDWYHLTKGEKRDANYWIEKRTKDMDEDEEGDVAEELFCTEGDLMEWGDSLVWCEAYETDGEEATYSLCNGEIASIRYKDGTESHSPSGEEIEALARKVNPDFDEYEGREAAEILTDASFRLSGGCRACPWFSTCDAMTQRRC